MNQQVSVGMGLGDGDGKVEVSPRLKFLDVFNLGRGYNKFLDV